MNSIFKDEFYRIVDSEIVIEGLKKEYVFMHISDMHMSVNDTLSDEAEIADNNESEKTWRELREYFANTFGEPYTSEHTLSSEASFDKMIALAKELKPEALLLSGDMLNHLTGGSIRALRKKLCEYDGKYMFVPGNHDPGTSVGLTKDSVQVIDCGELLIVGIDNSMRTLSDLQLTELKALCTIGKPIIILQHIPAMTDVNRDYLTGFGEYFSVDINSEDKNAAELVRIEAQEPCVKAVLCGHIHGYRELGIAEGKRQISASSGLIGLVHRVTVRGVK